MEPETITIITNHKITVFADPSNQKLNDALMSADYTYDQGCWYKVAKSRRDAYGEMRRLATIFEMHTKEVAPRPREEQTDESTTQHRSDETTDRTS
jgi:hypothetical protein